MSGPPITIDENVPVPPVRDRLRLPFARLRARGQSFFVPLPEPEPNLVRSVHSLAQKWGKARGRNRTFKTIGHYEVYRGELRFGARVWRIT